MENNKSWFKEYQALTDDEKKLYKEYVLDDEQKIIVSNYDMFKEQVKLMTENPNYLKTSRYLNIVEEIALDFDFGMHIAKGLKKDDYIEEEIYRKLLQIDEQLELLSSEHNVENWTINAMKSDTRWIKAREIANEIMKLLL